MTGSLLAYEWVCPVCSKKQTGLETRDRASIEGQVVNALRSHVRTLDDDGHGPAGEYPRDFDPNDARQYVKVEVDVDDSTYDVRS